MKPIITNQEILLFADTSFSKQEFCNMDSFNRPANLSRIEELEKACWAGMLFEMLPELMTYSISGCKMFIWNILTANHYLLVIQGSYPHPVENETSVDPYLFLGSIHLN